MKSITPSKFQVLGDDLISTCSLEKGQPVVAFSLPVAGPATLEVYDVQGRIVVRREVGSLGVGLHRVKLDARGALPAGVYSLRLRQGERQAITRAVVMR